jgi:hypothetical protein
MAVNSPALVQNQHVFRMLVGKFIMKRPLRYPRMLEDNSNWNKLSKIGGFYGSDYEEYHLLGCYTMWLL